MTVFVLSVAIKMILRKGLKRGVALLKAHVYRLNFGKLSVLLFNGWLLVVGIK